MIFQSHSEKSIPLKLSLHYLGAITPDTLRKLPALLLQSHIMPPLNRRLIIRIRRTSKDGHRVLVHAAGITVEQNLHAILNRLDRRFTVDIGDRSLVRDDFAEEGYRKMGTEPGGHGGGGEGGSEEIGGGEESVKQTPS